MRKYLLLSFVLVLIDQATKLAVKGFNLFGMRHEGMHLYESIQVFPGSDILRWTFVENPGMAFGLNFGMPVVLSLFSIGASVFLVIMLRNSERHKSKGLALALCLILAGAVGNLIDRVFYGAAYGYAGLFYGKVVDFVDVDLPDIDIFGFHLERFYVFNVADACVTIGVILLLIFYPKKHETQVVSEDPTATPVSPLPGVDERDADTIVHVSRESQPLSDTPNSSTPALPPNHSDH